jgi:hypothetical protein
MDEEEYIESVEALAWLEKADGKERDIREDPSCLLDLDTSLQLVKKFYAAGAVEVRALDVIIGEEYEFAQGIEIMLPSDEAKQAQLYALGIKALREMDSPYDDVDRDGVSFKLVW